MFREAILKNCFPVRSVISERGIGQRSFQEAFLRAEFTPHTFSIVYTTFCTRPVSAGYRYLGETHMAEHKAWNWDKADRDSWKEPAQIAYYLAARWKRKGYSRLFDLGCGLGRHSLFFAQQGFTVDAFDLSSSVLEPLRTEAADKKLNITVRSGDMISLPYKDDSFDCLLAYHVISHTDTAGIKKILSEIKRTVKSGGELYVTLCSKNAWSYKEAGFPVLDENTVIKVEDGPENGIPHFFADAKSIPALFEGIKLVDLQHTQDMIVDGKEYGSWHYFILGENQK